MRLSVLCCAVIAGFLQILEPTGASTLSSPDGHGVIGQSRTLQCADTTTNPSSDGYNMKKNGSTVLNNAGEIRTTGKYIPVITGMKVHVTITNVSIGDESPYTCEIGFGGESTAYMLKVENDPSAVTMTGRRSNGNLVIESTGGIYPIPTSVVVRHGTEVLSGSFTTKATGFFFELTWTSSLTFSYLKEYILTVEVTALTPWPGKTVTIPVPWWVVLLLIILGLLVYCILLGILLLIAAYFWKEPAQWWLRCLLILMLLSIVDSLVIICVLCFCRRSNAARKLKKLFCCGATNDDVEDVVFVLLAINCIPMTLGLILLVPRCVKSGRFSKAVRSLWCGCCDKKNSGDHPIEQRVRHSDPGRDKTDGVSKQKNEHSKALINTPGNANQQLRDSGAVSRTDIELTEGNYGQEKPVLRPQPPLPGIGKSHQQVDEPPHKKTRDLSSNFEDPNSLPQFEVRKHSLAPINVTAEDDGDSTARKKKKKKKKTEGSDTARSDEDN